jgi:hypothetical protein
MVDALMLNVVVLEIIFRAKYVSHEQEVALACTCENLNWFCAPALYAPSCRKYCELNSLLLHKNPSKHKGRSRPAELIVDVTAGPRSVPVVNSQQCQTASRLADTIIRPRRYLVRLMEEEGGQMERRQIVVFMRHAIAVHNLRDPVTGQPPNLYDPALLDPPLVARGKTAAVEAGERVRTWWHTTQLGENIQLIITSPLTRCIQTAVLAFLPGDEYGHCTPFVCMEGVREAFGSHFPDQRRSKSALMVRI